jgi:hypothetical protein
MPLAQLRPEGLEVEAPLPVFTEVKRFLKEKKYD